MRVPGLSATLIVRNEAAHLRRCLASIQPFTDEIIVVDTGSSDDSAAVASSFGARVFALPWRGDFAAARNHALEQATRDWILYIDADECARPVDAVALKAALADPALVAATVRFRNRTGVTRYEEYRLFRNDPRIRFRNVIHETVMPDVRALERNEGRRIVRTALALDHFGYDDDQTTKHRRNIPLLRARLAVDPLHVYSWNHLGEALAGTGDEAGAREAWQRAIALVRESETVQALDALPYGSLLIRDLGSRGVGETADPSMAGLLVEARERFPRDLLFQWLHGLQLVAREDYDGAAALLEPLTAIDPETFCADDGIGYDERIFGAPTWEALAICHFQCGRYAQSGRCYARLAELDPDNLEYRAKRRAAEGRALADLANA
ncbi:MAG: glycosyltransferase [Vicinamibacterales bacterium]